MTRIQQYQEDVRQITLNMIKNSMPSARVIDAEICWNLDTIGMTWDWTKHKVVAGLESKFIADLGLIKCKKSEAHILLVIGEKTEEGCFIIGRHKNIWLKPY